MCPLPVTQSAPSTPASTRTRDTQLAPNPNRKESPHGSPTTSALLGTHYRRCCSGHSCQGPPSKSTPSIPPPHYPNQHSKHSNEGIAPSTKTLRAPHCRLSPQSAKITPKHTYKHTPGHTDMHTDTQHTHAHACMHRHTCIHDPSTTALPYFLVAFAQNHPLFPTCPPHPTLSKVLPGLLRQRAFRTLMPLKSFG